MPKPQRIAIILPDTLQSIGLRSLLIGYFSPIEIEIFSSFNSFSLIEDLFDHYFTLPETIVLHADFFMLKRSKLIPVISGDYICDCTSSANCLIINTPQEEIIEQLRALIKKEARATNFADSGNTLSMREIDVLQLIVRGVTNKETADRLCISLNTVLTHRKNITSKLGIKTVPGLTFYAITNGIISGDEIKL